jgi:hypothetical protein
MDAPIEASRGSGLGYPHAVRRLNSILITWAEGDPLRRVHVALFPFAGHEGGSMSRLVATLCPALIAFSLFVLSVQTVGAQTAPTARHPITFPLSTHTGAPKFAPFVVRKRQFHVRLALRPAEPYQSSDCHPRLRCGSQTSTSYLGAIGTPPRKRLRSIAIE